MRTLTFRHAGKDYACSLEPETLGHVTQYGEHHFPLPHPSWVIIGFSTHHWHNRITIPLTTDIDPRSIYRAYVWDSDHGTTRTWGGKYFGKLPRIDWAITKEAGK
jgi:hypothetical protein